ncbi:putative NAD dependent epimerase dehydratase [Rosellinia necatrix]|uniref:Putative NAD dependent epimerase dehydratase n=1 Tax=Rosellinia necatrix TaxID=77044 RepID=A0A1W2TV36_ROSNE|nr:putative NAD dependent epimerase dehydratase [Rosellinia necatrix]
MKSSAEYPLRQCGIYRNIPDFDPSIKDLSAVICGANGISGFATLRALLDAPERWRRIYTLSRSPLSAEQMSLIPPERHSHIKQVRIDLSSPGEEIAKALREANVQADYAFFYSYVQPAHTSDSGMSVEIASALVGLNVPMFENFLQGLEMATLKPKRIVLQTGGKNYGVHIGRTRTPFVESDPQPQHLGPNFYYGQEDLLFKYCQKHPETGWNIVRPVGIIGVAQRAPLNAFYPFAVYAAVQAQKGEPLYFGGEFESWQFEYSHSTARMTAYLTEWAVLEDQCKNEAFNAQDGGSVSYDRFYAELARWYGVEKGVQNPDLEESKYHIQNFAGGKEAPLGYGPPVVLKTTFRLADWFQQPENKAAWEEIMAKSNGQVKVNVFEDPAMKNLISEFDYARRGNLSMNKSRIMGFCGFVDTLESLFETYQETAIFGALPKMKVASANALI